MLFVKDYTCVILMKATMQSMEVVQTLNRTSLSDRPDYRVWESRKKSR